MMNAGIYEPGGIALGFHVEKGETLLPLNKEEAQANLYLKPDGRVLAKRKKRLLSALRPTARLK